MLLNLFDNSSKITHSDDFIRGPDTSKSTKIKLENRLQLSLTQTTVRYDFGNIWGNSFVATDNVIKWTDMVQYNKLKRGINLTCTKYYTQCKAISP